MRVIVQQNQEETFHELTRLEIKADGIDTTFFLDLDFAAVLERSWKANVKGLDFLIIAAVCYGVDKIVPRANTADRWRRDFELSIPLSVPEDWTEAAGALNESLSFLTGDTWTLKFTRADRPFQQRRANRRKSPIGFPNSPFVSLLSGGLDSFIGALDLLEENPECRILFVSHYDRHVSGPASDQDELRKFLARKFLGRIAHFQVRVGVVPAEGVAEGEEKYKFETSFRSRSLIFLGLGVYAATKIGGDTPVIIPENGPIALNLPLNPSRRGACSTRTVHPYFLSSLRKALALAGIENPISNPYELKTKGEMVSECSRQDLLKEAYELSNSCGKAGRKMYWENRHAKACGACVPCLFRRASLHASGMDTETFGNDVLKANPEEHADFHALLGLVRRNPAERDIAKSLLANGRLPLAQLSAYAGVVHRLIGEVRNWLADKGSPRICELAGIKRKSGK